MYPLKMVPVYKDYIWGGDNLNKKYGKKSPYEITAESWEVASHKNGESTVENGEYKGMTINQLMDKLKEKLLGDKFSDCEKFPLLIKFIDAKDNLSVQVHPDDIYASKNENGEMGKTEMWYVMHAEDGAGLIYGFKNELSKEEFKNAIEDNSLLSYTNFVECKKGDCFFISAGTLHAIGKGLIIAEIQQNSDTTYRVYDYDRRDANGNPRPLHIEKAIDVTSLKLSTDCDNKTPDNGVIAKCDYFTTEKITVDKEKTYEVDKSRFETLVVCEGEVTINDVSFKSGESALIPAYIGQITIKGNGVLLRSYI